jgi:hypothetical protein
VHVSTREVRCLHHDLFASLHLALAHALANVAGPIIRKVPIRGDYAEGLAINGDGGSATVTVLRASDDDPMAGRWSYQIALNLALSTADRGPASEAEWEHALRLARP